MIVSEKLRALISLLDDPEQVVWESAMRELSGLEYDHVEILNTCLDEQDLNPDQYARLEDCITGIRYQHLGRELIKWKLEGGKDLLEAIATICQLKYPEANYNYFHEKLEALRLDAWLEFHYDLTSFEKVKIINYILFQLHGFRGDEENFLHSDNSFLNKVLENKKGNPISLSIIYIIIAQRLNVPVYGVNLPRHFIMAYVENEENDKLYAFNSSDEVPEIAEGDIKFYINAYNGGGVFNKEQLLGILKEMEFEQKPEYMFPCTHIEIVLRVLMNLANSYISSGNQEAIMLNKVIEDFNQA